MTRARRLLASSFVVLLISAVMLLPLSRFGLVFDQTTAVAGHGVIFLIVGVLVMGQLSHRRLAALAVLLVWSVALEAGQFLIAGRTPDLADLGANSLGLLLAYALVRWGDAIRLRRQ
ncbi:MAG: VanZ family protein [Hyphomicrobiales bacterium]|nr:VanZ family protein [Hyphomicrobiales bacterium]